MFLRCKRMLKKKQKKLIINRGNGISRHMTIWGKIQCFYFSLMTTHFFFFSLMVIQYQLSQCFTRELWKLGFLQFPAVDSWQVHPWDPLWITTISFGFTPHPQRSNESMMASFQSIQLLFAFLQFPHGFCMKQKYLHIEILGWGWPQRKLKSRFACKVVIADCDLYFTLIACTGRDASLVALKGHLQNRNILLWWRTWY